MTQTFVPQNLPAILEDLKKRLSRVERSSGSGDSIGAGAIQFVNGQAVVNTIVINGPGGQTIVTTPKLGDLVPSGLTATPSWEDGLLLGQAGNSVVDLDWRPGTGLGANQIIGWQIKVGVVGEPFFSYYQASETPQRIRNLKPGANYVVYVSPIDQFGNVVAGDAAAASATFTAAFNSGAPAWNSTKANLEGYAGYASVTLTWDDDTDDTDVGGGNGSYDVQLAEDGIFTKNVQSQRISGTICTFGNLVTGTTYYLRIRALNNSGFAGSDGVPDQWIVYGGTSPIGLTPGAVDANATSIDPGAVRNTQTTFLVSAGLNNPLTPPDDFTDGSDGNLTLNQNGAAGTPLARVSDLAAFDTKAIKFAGGSPGGAARTGGPYYSGLQPGSYKAVFYLKSTETGLASDATVCSISVVGPPAIVEESGQQTIVTGANLGVTGSSGAADGSYHAIAIPLTITTPFSGDSGVQFVVTATAGARSWSLSHVSVVPYTALIQQEVTASYLAAASVVAGKIAANAISAENLQIQATTPYRNLNFDFEDVLDDNIIAPSHWTLNWDAPTDVGSGPANIFVQQATVYSGQNAIAIRAQRIDATHWTGGGIASDAFSVNPGEVLTIDGWLRQDTLALTGGVSVRVAFGTTPNFTTATTGTTYLDLPGLSNVGTSILPVNAWTSIATVASSVNGTNLLTAQDSSFESPGVGTWVTVGNAATMARTTAQAYVGSASMSITVNTGGTQIFRTDIYALAAGQVGRARARFRSSTATRVALCRIEFTDSAGNTISYQEASIQTSTTGWVTATASGTAPTNTTGARVVVLFTATVANEIHYVDGVELLKAVVTNNQVSVPAGKTYARVIAQLNQPTGAANGTVSTLYVDRLQVSGAILGTQIANGTISTAHILAGTLDADRLTAQSITTAQIRAGSIDADRLTAGSITARQIGAEQITADKIAGGQISADKLAANMVMIGNQVMSGSYSQGRSGWTIQANGFAEFNNVNIRGVLYAATLASNTFDFMALGGTSIGMRINTSTNGSASIQLGQGSVNVGTSIGYDTVSNQWQFNGYINSPGVPVFKFSQGFVEFDNPRSTGGFATLPFYDNGIQGYFVGRDYIGQGQAPWDERFGLQLQKLGPVYNVMVQGFIDSEARHVGLRNTRNNIEGLYIDGYQGAASRTVSYGNIAIASDIRLKQDIQEIFPEEDRSATDVVKQLKPLRYKMKAHRGQAGKRNNFGFSAQDVQKILPEAVQGGLRFSTDDEEETMLGITYDSFIPVLVQHNQEQQQEIDELKATVKKLEKRIRAL